MHLLRPKHNHFYSDLPNYANRLLLLSLCFFLAMPLSELFLAEFWTLYPAEWLAISVLSGLNLIFAFTVLRFELTKKRMATMATVNAILGTVFLIYRCVVNDFSPVLLAELTAAIILISFVYERLKFLMVYATATIISVLITLPYLDFQNDHHIAFLFIIGFLAVFYALSFSFKMARIKLLIFSQRALSTYDKYIIVCNDKGDVVYVSPHIINELGMDVKAVQEGDWWKLRGLPEDEIARYRKIIVERIKKDEHIPLYEQVLTKPGGEKRVIQWNAQVIAGKYHVGLGTDITDSLNAQKEAEKLSKVSVALGAGVSIVNKEGQITWCNSSFCSIFGYEEHELLGRRPSQIFAVPEFFADRYKKLVAKGIKSGEQYEIPHYHKTGRLIWVLVKSSHLLDENGDHTESIEVVTDITRQKNNELEFKQISLIAERTQTPVLICDRLFVINWLNSALMTEFERDFDEIIGNDFLSFYAGEWTENEPVEVLLNALKNNDSCQIDIQLKKNNEPQWYKLSMDPIKDDFGNISQFMIVMQNIQKLKDAQMQIESKNKDMVASISYAKRIQSALLPDAKILEERLPDHFFLYSPKDIVSGDFYYAKFHGNRLFIAVADCTGHGVPGAMITSIGAAALNNAIFDHGLTDPGKILEQTDIYLKYALSASEEGLTDGMDIGIIALNFEANTLEYAGARRPLILMDRLQNELTCLHGDKRSIGEFMEDDFVPFVTQTVEVKNDTCIYLFTDGITDQFGGEKYKKLRYKRVLELIHANYNKDISEQQREIEQFFKQWTHDYSVEQTDDMLLFAANINLTYMLRMKTKIEKLLHYEG